MPTQEQITHFLQQLLFIGIGFVAGYIVTWLACLGIDKTLVKGKTPDGLQKWARRIGGVLVALVVAFFLFRGGTGTGGGGPDTGQGSGTPATSSSTAPSTDPTTPTSEKLPEVAVDAVPVYVTVYAGAAVERGSEKFYALGDSSDKVALAAVSDRVREASKDKGKVFVVYTLDVTASTALPMFQLLKAETDRQGVPLVSKADFVKLRK